MKIKEAIEKLNQGEAEATSQTYTITIKGVVLPYLEDPSDWVEVHDEFHSWMYDYVNGNIKLEPGDVGAEPE